MREVMTMVSKEQFAKLLTEGYEKRAFVVGHLKDFSFHLNEMEAYAFNRIVPKELMSKLLMDRQSKMLMDKILDYHSKISKDGPVAEVEATKVAEETFLTSKGLELLSSLQLALPVKTT